MFFLFFSSQPLQLPAHSLLCQSYPYTLCGRCEACSESVPSREGSSVAGMEAGGTIISALIYSGGSGDGEKSDRNGPCG